MTLPKLDWVIVLCTILLCSLGGAIISSVAPEVFWSQLVFYLFGFTLFFFFSQIDYRIFENTAKFQFLLGLAGLLFTLFLGFESRGSVRWIPLGLFNLQVSEVFKPFFVAAMAAFAIGQKKSFFSFLTLLGLAMVPTLLVFKQPDLGSAIVYVAITLAIMFASGSSLRHFLYLGIAFVLSLPFGWHFLADYQKRRINTFLNPTSDPLGASYNVLQAVMTVGSGMFFGRGLGRGTQSHLLFLPERHTDFVFASFSEEIGFVGSFILLILFFVILWRIFSIASQSSDKFGALICVGVGMIILTQVVVNVGMNLGILPVTGITLPLISYGGSSILSIMIALGIVQNVHSRISKNSTIRL